MLAVLATPLRAEELPPAGAVTPVRSPGEEGCPPPRTLKKCGELGQRYYETGLYELALQALQQAYVLDPRPIFLFNMAQAQRQLGHTTEALALYDRYLQKDPQTEHKAEVQGYMADLHAKQEAERQKEEAERHRQQMLAVTMAVPPPRSPQRPVYRRAWFWGVMGAAGAVVIGGVIAGVVLGTQHGSGVPDNIQIHNWSLGVQP